ncbi:patatin-like phospholipase family protein [Pedobacter sp.]|jgi:hypothetical protein|uniref:patatin-like phospholipase family protein n=1 Tax=Pedobacter sp. TaxID=1411316 RepID=UPI002B9F9165|nr:patatin-like phospholipase family protein [Pedobacter sp.]HWW42311.1 patatin-like phospholipase family protein [Pedobacter sp.]
MENIALALSGGGFRAALFSVGSLSYLNRLKVGDHSLLQQVKYISSSSGGSIANLVYSSYIFKGKTFEEAYVRLWTDLDGEDLIKRAFKLLKDDRKWKHRREKSRNLVNAFALAYDELFEGLNFELFSDRSADPHLDEICINATEFANGVSFRFQSQHPGNYPKGRIGNAYIKFKARGMAAAKKMKLADILASSSCFPGGFEPVVFPDDFVYKGLSKHELLEHLVYKYSPSTLPKGKDWLHNPDFDKNTQFCLMDGGVADNQGIESMVLANERRREKFGDFSMMILCDVTSYFMDAYTFPTENRKHWYERVNIQQLINLLKIFAVLNAGMLVSAFLFGWHNWVRVLTIPGLLVTFLYLLGTYRLSDARRVAAEKQNTWVIVFFKYVDYFLKVRISAVQQMIMARFKSVMMMNTDIYLKQIRRLYYDKIFKHSKLKKVAVMNSIYELSKANQKLKKEKPKLKTEVGFSAEQPVITNIKASEAMMEVAEKARTMDTTLWFDDNHTKDNRKAAIIATAQFTLCYNLINHFSQPEKAMALTQEEQDLKRLLLQDWHLFHKDPYFMYNEMGKQLIPDFAAAV